MRLLGLQSMGVGGFTDKERAWPQSSQSHWKVSTVHSSFPLAAQMESHL